MKNNQNIELFNATDLLRRNIAEIPCLIENLMPRVGLCSVAGSSDTGKSSFLRQLAVSVSLGDRDFLDFKINAEHNRAIYISTEDDDQAMSFLLNKANSTRKLKFEDYNGLNFIFDSHEVVKKLDNYLNTIKVDLIVVDAFTDLYGKSMNDTNQVRSFLNEYGQLAQKHKCLIVFLHHTGKRTDDLPPSKHNLLGSQGYEAKMRMVMELRKDKNDPSIRHLCIVKGNYLPSEFKTKSHVLRFDNNLQFINTKEMRDFDELTKDHETKEEQIKCAKHMQQKGMGQEEIARTMNVSQSTVSRLLAD